MIPVQPNAPFAFDFDFEPPVTHEDTRPRPPVEAPAHPPIPDDFDGNPDFLDELLAEETLLSIEQLLPPSFDFDFEDESAADSVAPAPVDAPIDAITIPEVTPADDPVALEPVSELPPAAQPEADPHPSTEIPAVRLTAVEAALVPEVDAPSTIATPPSATDPAPRSIWEIFGVPRPVEAPAPAAALDATPEPDVSISLESPPAEAISADAGVIAAAPEAEAHSEPVLHASALPTLISDRDFSQPPRKGGQRSRSRRQLVRVRRPQ